MHSNCKQNIYEFTEICCNVLNFRLAHKSAQLFMGVAALIEPQACPPSSPDYPLLLTPSLSSCFLLSVLSACLLCCYFRYKLSAHIFAVLPIFNYTSCNMYKSPRTPSLSTSVSVASAAPSNWRPALCHAPHCRLICRVCCCTCHSLSLLHIYIYNHIIYIYSISNYIVYSFLFQSESGHTLKATQP